MGKYEFKKLGWCLSKQRYRARLSEDKKAQICKKDRESKALKKKQKLIEKAMLEDLIISENSSVRKHLSMFRKKYAKNPNMLLSTLIHIIRKRKNPAYQCVLRANLGDSLGQKSYDRITKYLVHLSKLQSKKQYGKIKPILDKIKKVYVRPVERLA